MSDGEDDCRQITELGPSSAYIVGCKCWIDCSGRIVRTALLAIGISTGFKPIFRHHLSPAELTLRRRTSTDILVQDLGIAPLKLLLGLAIHEIEVVVELDFEAVELLLGAGHELGKCILQRETGSIAFDLDPRVVEVLRDHRPSVDVEPFILDRLPHDDLLERMLAKAQ